MTRATFELRASAEDQRIAHLAAIAIALSAAEAAFPSPLPGVKPGIANIVILLVLHQYGWRSAIWISLLRVVAGSLAFGTFLTPGFVLSASGACASLLALSGAIRLPSRWFGAVTHSVLAALAHIAAQLLVVYFWLIPQAGLAYFVPIFAVAALAFGTVNGLVAAHLIGARRSTQLPPQALTATFS